MIQIPSQSLVVFTDGPATSVDALEKLLSASIVDWAIDDHAGSQECARLPAKSSSALIVKMPRHHPKALRAAARLAQKCGMVSVLQAANNTAGAEEFEIVLASTDGVELCPMPFDKRADQGPFDIIGDVHGCAEELMRLLERLGHADAGWESAPAEIWNAWVKAHPTGRRVVLLGDLTDRGPYNFATLRIARSLHRCGAYVIAGNHDDKLARWIQGRPVTVGNGLQMTIRELENQSADEIRQFCNWLQRLPRHLLLDEGRLVVAHAGLAESLHHKATPESIAFATYGKTAAGGAIDEHGYPVQVDWAAGYQGPATVVHGHVVHAEPRELNRVHAIDTGCVFGGKLTAMRWPEKTYVQVAARKTYFQPRKNV